MINGIEKNLSIFFLVLTLKCNIMFLAIKKQQLRKAEREEDIDFIDKQHDHYTILERWFGS